MDLNVERNVSEILAEGDVRLEDTEAIIWNWAFSHVLSSQSMVVL